MVNVRHKMQHNRYSDSSPKPVITSVTLIVLKMLLEVKEWNVEGSVVLKFHGHITKSCHCRWNMIEVFVGWLNKQLYPFRCFERPVNEDYRTILLQYTFYMPSI